MSRAPRSKAVNLRAASLLWALLATSADAGPLEQIQSFATDPVAPSTYQPTTIVMKGWWNNGCVPKLLSVNIAADHVTVVLHSRQLVCTEAFAVWLVKVPVGVLEAGTYSVSVLHLMVGALGSSEFDVTEPLGATLHGALPRKTACVNLTTGQRVVVREGAAQVNCEAAGLAVHPGDKVVVRAFGLIGAAP